MKNRCSLRRLSDEDLCREVIEKSAHWDDVTCVEMDLQVTPELYLHALEHGVFPWNDTDEPRMWWNPDPRAVLLLDEFHISRSLAKCMRQRKFEVTFDQAFEDTLRGCADRLKTWLDPELQTALSVLHDRGIAHSVECWRDGRMVGGVYGMAVNGIFVGDSMFHTEPNASKVALAHLVDHLRQCGFTLMDCQVLNDHTMSLGAINIPRGVFHEHLAALRRSDFLPTWQSVP